MCLRYSLGRPDEAKLIEGAVEKVLNDGLRTGDIMQPGKKLVGPARWRWRHRRPERAEFVTVQAYGCHGPQQRAIQATKDSIAAKTRGGRGGPVEPGMTRKRVRAAPDSWPRRP